jgi:hypothetical protein
LSISFAALATAALLAGCGSKTGGTPTAPPSPATGESSSPARKVPAALNTSSLLADACSALSDAQLSTLGLGKGTPRTTENGPTCAWTYSGDQGNRVDISPAVPNKNGLSDIEDLKGSNAYFDDTEIAGYPAVHTAVVDYRSEGQCGLFVGVTDQLAVQIFTQLDHGPGATDPCPVADRVGAAMIETLKEG